MENLRVDEESLKSFIVQAFERIGIDGNNAAEAAEIMVEADLRGIDSHGARKLEGRVNAMEKGTLVATAEPELVTETGAVAVFDGHHGYGPVLCAHVMKKCMELAKKHTIGLATIRNSSHWGCPAYYVRKMAKNGYVGFIMTNTPPVMPLWGSSEESVGNNPIAIAVPRRNDEPIVLDMAMQQASWGKLMLYDQLQQKVPAGWGFDLAGNPTDDPGEILRSRRSRPIGDYKGSGLAVMIEMLTGILSMGTTCYQISPKGGKRNPAKYCHTFIGIRIENIMPMDGFLSEVEEFYRTARSSKLAEGFAEILLPGDRSNNRMKERREKGIPLEAFKSSVENVSKKLGIPVPWKNG